MGFYNAAFYSALALGPFIGGALYDQMGLEAPFYFWTLLGIASIIIVTFKVPESRGIVLKADEQPQRREESLIAPGYAITFLACCAVILWSGVVGGFNITLLPSYAKALGLSTTDIGLIFLGSLAGLISFALLFIVSNLIQVLILFAGLGLGLGICSPAAAALVADTTNASRRGETYGIHSDRPGNNLGSCCHPGSKRGFRKWQGRCR